MMIGQPARGGGRRRPVIIGWLLVLAAAASRLAGAHWVRPGRSEPLDLPAPPLSLRAFDGRTETLADLHGQPVVVIF
jgi:hypothetical protein